MAMAGKLLVVQRFTVIVERFNYTELFKPTGAVQNKHHQRVYVYVTDKTDIKVLDDKECEADRACLDGKQCHSRACAPGTSVENRSVRYFYCRLYFVFKITRDIW